MSLEGTTDFESKFKFVNRIVGGLKLEDDAKVMIGVLINRGTFNLVATTDVIAPKLYIMFAFKSIFLLPM